MFSPFGPFAPVTWYEVPTGPLRGADDGLDGGLDDACAAGTLDDALGAGAAGAGVLATAVPHAARLRPAMASPAIGKH